MKATSATQDLMMWAQTRFRMQGIERALSELSQQQASLQASEGLAGLVQDEASCQSAGRGSQLPALLPQAPSLPISGAVAQQQGEHPLRKLSHPV